MAEIVEQKKASGGGFGWLASHPESLVGLACEVWSAK